jgi:hypothetical protein
MKAVACLGRSIEVSNTTLCMKNPPEIKKLLHNK